MAVKFILLGGGTILAISLQYPSTRLSDEKYSEKVIEHFLLGDGLPCQMYHSTRQELIFMTILCESFTFLQTVNVSQWQSI